MGQLFQSTSISRGSEGRSERIEENRPGGSFSKIRCWSDLFLENFSVGATASVDKYAGSFSVVPCTNSLTWEPLLIYSSAPHLKDIPLPRAESRMSWQRKRSLSSRGRVQNPRPMSIVRAEVFKLIFNSASMLS